MVSNELLQTIVASGIAGAGLIFAAYSIIIAFSDKLKEFRVRRRNEARKLITKTQPTEKLRELLDELEKVEATPFYLSVFVYVIFLLYIVSSISGLLYLAWLPAQKTLATISFWSFGASTFLFGILGISLLQDSVEFMQDFLKIKEQKKKNKKDKKKKNGL